MCAGIFCPKCDSFFVYSVFSYVNRLKHSREVICPYCRMKIIIDNNTKIVRKENNKKMQINKFYNGQ
jgi:hypothetical protein